MEQEIYSLVGRIIELVQNIEYFLVDGVKMSKILNVYNKCEMYVVYTNTNK